MNIIDIIAQDVFDKIRSRFSNLEMGNEAGAVTSNPTEARFFDFDFAIEGNLLGRVSISINEPGTLKVFYGQTILDNADSITREYWYDFLKDMRQFAKRRMLRFDTRDITKQNLNKTDFKYLAKNSPKDESMSESKMFGSSKSSYLPLEKTRLIIRHSKPVDETQLGGRSRNIKSLYIENQEGERFKYPFAHLAGAKAMQRHVANGGRPYDDHGKAIINMSETIAKLGAFKRLVGRHDSMNMEANNILEQSCMKLDELRNQLHQLSKQGHYEAWKEAYMPMSDEEMIMDQATMETYKSNFTISSFKEDLTQYFPLIDSIMREAGTVELDQVVGREQAVAEDQSDDFNLTDEFETFESWANAVVEGRLEPDVVKALEELLSQSLTLGVDGTSAIEALQGIGVDDKDLNDALEQLAKVNPEADPAPTINAWLEVNAPEAASAPAAEEPAPEEPAPEEPAAGNFASEVPPEEEGMAGVEAGSAVQNMMPEGKPDMKKVAEMVKSFYDRETGNFPLGETGVITKVKKELGDHAAAVAERFISQLQGQNQMQQEMADVVRLSGNTSALDRIVQRSRARKSGL